MEFEGRAAANADSLLDAVRAAALRAGEAILRVAHGGTLGTRAKDDASPLTAADLAANEVLLDALRAIDPATAVVSEEAPCALDTLPPRYWLIDPLDGTREFIAGNGEYSVNVALVERGEPVLGVVHAPARGVTYAAARGRGAVRADAAGEQRIHARRDGRLAVVASRSHRGDALDAFLERLPPHDVVAIGSSLKLCLVADGTAHLYPRLGPTCWWDTAAAHAVALEAGATVTTLDGVPLRYAGDGFRNPWFVCSSLPCAAWSDAASAVA